MKTLIVAPHPDDELLGCGGALLRRHAEGGTVGWLLITAVLEKDGYDSTKVQAREREILQVREGLCIKPDNLFSLEFSTTKLDRVPTGELVGRISQVFKRFEPEEVFVPYAHDIHSDHRIVFEAVAACSKWFRYPSIKRILAYETLSETDCILDAEAVFKPNVFVDISMYLERKLQLLSCYQSELGEFPFPRSESAVRALAQVRGAQSGFMAAEAFQLLRERY
ncbi:MAG: GlcNAc-PI de-N-acetylase [Hydrogenophilales bacterium 28-61-23]|nr:MAG: GlcNAc-PI de-N-acetylase [Hydrogenophilales bacterium 28-61-23]